MKTEKKEALVNFENLEPKIARQITPIKLQPEMVAARAKLDGLREQVKAIEEKLNTCYEPYQEGQQGSSVETDAAKVLSGVAVAALPMQSIDSQKQNLARQCEVLKQAILIQEGNCRVLEMRLIREGCKAFEAIAKKYVGQTIAAFEAVEKALREQEILFEFLQHQGYRNNLRPEGWQTSGFESAVLFGGNVSQLWCLRYWIEQRRKVWDNK